MKDHIKNRLLSVLRVAPLAVCAVLMGVYLLSGDNITADGLLNYAPEEPLLAAAFLLLLYAFKSLTVFFPIVVLNVLGGFLFEPVQALLLNSVGVLIELAIPYWIGRASGAGFADKLCQKHPKLAEIVGEGSGNNFFMSFFLRIISCLPGDAISMYLGACRVPFWTCLIASFLGTLPGLVSTTLLGTSITDPASPMFWISVGLTVGLSILSLLFYGLWRKLKKNRNAPEPKPVPDPAAVDVR